MPKYMIIDGSNLNHVENMVNEWIEEGYIVTGGLTVFNDGTRNVFCQAMIKKDGDKNE